MKKLLGIVVTVLFWCNASYAELITLTNCYIVKYDDTDGENFSYRNFDEQTSAMTSAGLYIHDFENRLYTLDTVTEVITETRVIRDSYINWQKQRNNLIIKKYRKIIFKVTDLGGNVATATDIDLGHLLDHTVDVDFATNKVYTFRKDKWSSNSSTQQCKRQK